MPEVGTAPGGVTTFGHKDVKLALIFSGAQLFAHQVEEAPA